MWLCETIASLESERAAQAQVELRVLSLERVRAWEGPPDSQELCYAKALITPGGMRQPPFPVLMNCRNVVGSTERKLELGRTTQKRGLSASEGKEAKAATLGEVTPHANAKTPDRQCRRNDVRSIQDTEVNLRP